MSHSPYARKLGLVAMIATLALPYSNIVFAFGSSPGGNIDSEVAAIAKDFKWSPYADSFRSQFERADKPTVEVDGAYEFNDAILMKHEYKCDRFYGLKHDDPTRPFWERTTYKFRKKGSGMIENLTVNDEPNARVQFFVPSATLQGELIGSISTFKYFETLRVKKNGDLLIEGYADNVIWVKVIFGWFGLGSWGDKLGKALMNLAKNAASAAGYLAVDYAYCPRDPDDDEGLREILEDAKMPEESIRQILE